MQNCYIVARKIASKSLKHFCITNNCNFPDEFHVQIFAQCLISLQFDDFSGFTPSLEYMPFLVTSYVGLGTLCRDVRQCICKGYDVKDCSCHVYPVDEGVLLHGLSNVVNLELLAAYRTETVCLHYFFFHSFCYLPPIVSLVNISIHCRTCIYLCSLPRFSLHRWVLKVKLTILYV